MEEIEKFCDEYKDHGFYGIIKVEKIKLLENLIKAYKETKEDKIHLENLILREYVSKFIIKEELKEAEKKYKTYKAGIKENENLKSGMWRHLGEVHMCKKLLGIERNIVALDTKLAEENTKLNTEVLIEELTKVNPDNLSKEGLELFNKMLEIIDKNQELKSEINQLNKIIDKMAEYIEQEATEYQLDEIYASLYKCNGMERNWTRGKEEELEDIKKYFREEVEK